MIYWIVILGGVICGFLAPPAKKSFRAFFASGVLFLVGIALVAALLSYDARTIMSLLLLDDIQSRDTLGLIQLAGVAYACILASLVVGVRYVISLRGSNRGR